MKRVPLSDVSELIDYGVTASADDRPVGPKFLRITDIQDGAVDWNTVPFCQSDARKLAASKLRVGDIVFARTGATTGKSFLIKSCPTDAVFASYLIRVRPNRLIDPSFLAHFFDSPDYWSQISLKAVGAAQPGINSSKLKELEVPLLPIQEQERIAAILDQADEVRRKQLEAIEIAERFPHALFLEMFGDPTPNSEKWPRDQLRHLGKVSTGGTPPSNHDGMFNGPIPFVTPGDLGSNQTVRRSVTEAGAAESKAVRAGATLVCCIGATIGKMGIASQRSAFNQQINGIEWSDSINDQYGFHAMSFFRGRIAALGASTTLPILKKSSFEKLEIPVPPLDLQEAFCARVSQCGPLLGLYRRRLEKLDTLFASLRHRAFQSELTGKQAGRELAEVG
jgi:type I restriction enzyme, S subunit